MKKKRPVITVDGPSGVGKGTLSRRLATTLGWHFLDSGALYRVLAMAAINHAMHESNISGLTSIASHLDVVFDQDSDQIILEGQDVTTLIRTEQCGAMASKIAAIPEVRSALLDRQRAFLQDPGLVADGRDMGTIVFPEADLKLFLDATAEERAKRRQMQLKAQGIDVSLDTLFGEIAARDKRDRERPVAPLVAAQDAIVLDTTVLSIQAVFDRVMEEVMRLGFKPK